MIIKRIHIDRFGGLSDFSLSFHDGFNLIFGNNEDGKTTVMSFLRLMFYGEVTKKTDLSLNLRRRFTPFSSERMGGEVEFSHDGKTYLLSKQFGKTPRSDRVSLIDLSSGESVPLIAGKEIGETFFSLSAEAFERSIYIGSLPTDSDGSAELSERLRRLAFSGEDGSSFEQVIERLQKAKLSLRTPRRVGLSDKLEDEISALKKRVEEAKQAEERRNQNCEQISRLEQQLASQNEKRAKLKTAEKQIAEHKSLDALRAERELRERYAQNKKAVAGITKEQLDLCKNAFTKAAALKALLSAEREKATVFAEGVSDSEILALLNSLDALSSEIKALSAEENAEGKKSSSPTFLFVAAAILTVLTAVLSVLKVSLFFIPLIPSAILFIAALAILKIGRDKNAQRLLENKSRLLALLEEKRQTNERYIILSERKKISDSANQKAEESKKKCTSLEAEISSLERYIRDELSLNENDYIEESLEKLSLSFVRLSECESSVNGSPFKSLSDAEIAARLESADVGVSITAEECERALLDTDRQIHVCLKEIERIRAENDVIIKSYPSVAVTENEIKEKADALARQQSHLAALTLAAQTLEDANADMRQGFAPELNRLTGEILSGLTGGRHSRVSVSDALSITVSEDGALPFSAEQLSAGSFDQAELSLRLAIAKLSGGENQLPLLLDDVLMQYDDERTKKALEFLYDYAAENQVLLFTCHGYQKSLVSSNFIINMKN